MRDKVSTRVLYRCSIKTPLKGDGLIAFTKMHIKHWSLVGLDRNASRFYGTAVDAK